MLEDGKITYKQIIFLIFISRIIITLTYLPSVNAPPGNQDVWLSDLLLLPMQLFFSIPVYFLWKRFPDKTIIQYSETILGKAGKLVGAFYIWFFIHFTAITLSQFNLFLTSTIMQETPILFFAVSIMFFCAYAARNGIEVIGRISEIVAPLIIIAVISIVVLIAKDMDLKVLLPVMENGIFPVIHGAVTPSARTVEILALAMVLPYLNNREKAKTVFILGFTVIIIFFLLIDVTTLTVLGVEEMKKHTFPFFSLVRLVSIGDFLVRIEAVHLGVWILGTFIKLSFYYYLAVLGMGQLLSLKDYRPLVFPTGVIIVLLSILIAPSIVELGEFTSYKIFTWYAMFFIILIPSILLITAVIRKKGGMKK